MYGEYAAYADGAAIKGADTANPLQLRAIYWELVAVTMGWEINGAEQAIGEATTKGLATKMTQR